MFSRFPSAVHRVPIVGFFSHFRSSSSTSPSIYLSFGEVVKEGNKMEMAQPLWPPTVYFWYLLYLTLTCLPFPLVSVDEIEKTSKPWAGAEKDSRVFCCRFLSIHLSFPSATTFHKRINQEKWLKERRIDEWKETRNTRGLSIDHFAGVSLWILLSASQLLFPKRSRRIQREKTPAVNGSDRLSFNGWLKDRQSLYSSFHWSSTNLNKGFRRPMERERLCGQTAATARQTARPLGPDLWEGPCGRPRSPSLQVFSYQKPEGKVWTVGLVFSHVSFFSFQRFGSLSSLAKR